MRYTSTRDKNVDVSSSWAIAQGISADGGLFVPVEIPKVSLDDIAAMANMSYVERAKRVLSLYLTDFTAEELAYCVEGAYGDNKFSSEDIAPIHELKAGEEILELWRGPTCAFKDMALQMLPRLMTVSVKRLSERARPLFLSPPRATRARRLLRASRTLRARRFSCSIPTRESAPCRSSR